MGFWKRKDKSLAFWDQWYEETTQWVLSLKCWMGRGNNGQHLPCLLMKVERPSSKKYVWNKWGKWWLGHSHSCLGQQKKRYYQEDGMGISSASSERQCNCDYWAKQFLSWNNVGNEYLAVQFELYVYWKHYNFLVEPWETDSRNWKQMCLGH